MKFPRKHAEFRGLQLKIGMRYLILSSHGLKNEPGEYFSNEFQTLKPLPYKLYNDYTNQSQRNF